MRYVVSDDFVQINETSGTVQNASKINIVEVSDSTVKGSGIMLYPMDRFTFSTSIYARCIESGGAEVRVVPFIVDGGGIIITGGGGSSSSQIVPEDQRATSEDIDSLIDDVFG